MAFLDTIYDGPIADLSIDLSGLDQVRGYYTTILKRDADDDGLNRWVEALQAGTSAEDIREAIIASAEVSATIAPLVRLYEAAFGRVPEDTGLAGWAAEMRAGTSFADIAARFVGSAEFQARYPEVAAGDLSGFITALYANALGRLPDTGGLNHWLTSGKSTAEILIGFSQSSEFLARSDANVAMYLNATGQGNTPSAAYSLMQLAPAEDLAGHVIDGKIAGATIGIDVNGDGVIGPDEPTVTTDNLGNFTFPDGSPTGNLISTGGTDISTGLAVTGELHAPAGSTVVTPLTNLISKLAALDTDPSKSDAQKAADAQVKLKELLGLTDIAGDITRTDFVTEASEGDTAGADGMTDLEAARLYAASVQVQNIVAQGAAIMSGLGIGEDAAADAVFNALAAAMSAVPDGQTVDLAASTTTDDDPSNDAGDFLLAVIKAAAGAVLSGDDLAQAEAMADSAARIAAAANREIADAVDGLTAVGLLNPNFGDIAADALVRIVQTQKVVQGEAADDLAAAAGAADPDQAADLLADEVAASDGSGIADESLLTSQNIGDVDGDGTDDDGQAGSENSNPGGVINPDNGPGNGGGGNTGGGGGGGGGVPQDTTPPAFTSASTVSIWENVTDAGTVTANEPATFAIAGGDDAHLFSITADGDLSFNAAPDFDNEMDADTDNTYEVTVSATDGAGNASQHAMEVSVEQVRVAAGESIQDAIDDAAAGDTIIIEDGTYVESLAIRKPVSLVAAEGATVTIAPDTGAAIGVRSAVRGEVSLNGIDLDGGGNNTSGRGIDFSPAAQVTMMTFANGSISGFSEAAVFAGNNGSPNANNPVSNLMVRDAMLFDNAYHPSQNVETSHIKLFGFEGDATFERVLFDGGDNTVPGDYPDSAIMLIGRVAPFGSNVITADIPAIGDIVINDITVTGAFNTSAVSISAFGDLDGLLVPDLGQSSNGLDLSQVTLEDRNAETQLLDIRDITAADFAAGGFRLVTANGASDPVIGLYGEAATEPDVDSVFAGSGYHDYLDGRGGNDLLSGGGGNDILIGGAGNDNLSGDGGADVLHGGAGDDQLTGGDDNDIFFFVPGGGSDTITDFTIGQDRLEFDKAIPDAFNALNSIDDGFIDANDANVSLTGDGDLQILIDWGAAGDNGTITLVGVTSLQVTDFVDISA